MSPFNVANGLTALRILLVPLFAYLLLADPGDDGARRWWAAAVFVIAIATDWVDGDLARRRHLVTNLGKIGDPIADKALVGAAFIGLSVLGELWWWVTIVVLGRELGITALRFVVIRHGVIPASSGGKLKTVLQSLALVLLLAPLGPAVQLVGHVVMGAAVVVTVVTGVDYLLQALRLGRQRDGAPR
nr:CDP-diacylglycerol--glycerol-3-phosphate 3-phosphatidyltransferase [Ornithinicoccus halotolerans]